MKRREIILGGLVAAGLLAATASAATARQAVYPHAPKGTVRIGNYYALDPTCAIVGLPRIQVLSGPSNGQIETRQVRDFPSYPTFNIRAKCDTQRVPMTEVLYRAAPGFHGVDMVTYAIIFPRGEMRRQIRRILVP